MKVCVTGGAGFIGQRLVDILDASGVDIKLLTRVTRFDTLHKQYFVGDLSDKHISLDDFLDGASVVYNCVGEVKNTALMSALHVDGTTRLLDAVGRKIRTTKQPVHWVQLSSVGAYGPPRGAKNEKRVVTEDTPCSPLGEYEVTKTIADLLVMKFAETEPLFSYTILRPSNVIGSSMPNQSLRSLISMVKKRLFFYIGSRTTVATYIHVDDVVAALILCGSDLRARGQIFNLSNDCRLSEIVNAVAKVSGFKQLDICIPEEPLRFLVKLMTSIVHIPLTQERIDALVRHTYYPSFKIKEVLNFVPKNDIPSTISSMFEE